MWRKCDKSYHRIPYHPNRQPIRHLGKFSRKSSHLHWFHSNMTANRLMHPWKISYIDFLAADSKQSKYPYITLKVSVLNSKLVKSQLWAVSVLYKDPEFWNTQKYLHARVGIGASEIWLLTKLTAVYITDRYMSENLPPGVRGHFSVFLRENERIFNLPKTISALIVNSCLSNFWHLWAELVFCPMDSFGNWFFFW